MARILPGGGVADIRGKDGGVVFSRNRGGNYIRRFVKPVNAQTARQLQVRASLSNAAKGWVQDLTQAQRDGWEAFAESNPITGKFGEQQLMTGSQAYIRLRVRAVEAGLNTLINAPADQQVEALTSATLTAEAGPDSLSLAYTATPLGANDHLQVFASPPISAGITNANTRLRLVHTSAAAAASPADILLDYQAVFGSTGSAGQKIICRARVIRANNLAVSPGLEATAIVDFGS